jgi:hypothetical protein
MRTAAASVFVPRPKSLQENPTRLVTLDAGFISDFS